MVFSMENGRTQKAIKNIVYNFLNQFLTMLLSFLSRTVFIHVLGAEYLGLNGLFSDVLGFLSLADLGFNTAMVYSFYKPLAQNDEKKLAALVTFYRKVYFTIAIATGLIGAILAPFLPYIVNLESEVPHLYAYYALSVFNIVVSYLCVYKTSILTANQKNYEIVKINMCFSILKTVLQIVVLVFYKEYIVYLLIGAVISLINNLVASRKAVKAFPFICNRESLESVEKIDIFKNMRAVFIYKVSSVLLNATDNVLISVLVGTVMVGYYSNYLMLSNKITQFYSILFTSLIAGVGNLVVESDCKKRFDVFRCEQTIGCIISCIIFPAYIMLANDLVKLWLGIEFVLPEKVVFAIGLNLYLACICHPLWSFREATGLYKKTKWIMLICGVLNIVLSVILGLKYGVFGILISSCISRVATYVWYEPYVLFREYFEASPSYLYKSLVLNTILVFMILLVCKNLLGKFVVESWMDLLLKGLIICVFSLFVTLCCYKNTNGFTHLKARLDRMRKNR